MGDKGNVYYCRWEKNSKGEYVAWEEKYPSRRATAATPDELISVMGDFVGEYHNDFEAAIQFDPPLPGKYEKEGLFKDQIVSIPWNSGFHCARDQAPAFSRGTCSKCNHATGARTAAPLLIDSIWGGCDGASSGGDQVLAAHLTIVTEAFLNLLDDTERSSFEARPVQWTTRRRLRFFEIIPKKVIPTVGIKGLPVDGWQCSTCGYKTVGCGSSLGWGVEVISRADLPSIASPFFFIGDPTFYTLCVSKKRWESLRGRPGTCKLMSERLAVVDEQECQRYPDQAKQKGRG